MNVCEDNLNKAGIYKLICMNNGKLYIGKSVNIERRLKQHKNSKGKCHFQNAILKYGWESFKVEILEIIENFDRVKDNEKLLTLESFYIELFDSTNKDKGYNICKHSNDLTGIPLSEEHKEKIRQSRLGIPLSEEHKEKLKKSHMGHIHSEETIRKMRMSMLGKKHSEESKEKMRQARTEESIEKSRNDKLGIPRSEETKQKIRMSNLGKPKSEEHKEKMRRAKLGRKHSEETKEKIRQSKLNRRIDQ